MTSTTDSAFVPEFPMPRAAGCPFDPPPALRDLQARGPLTRVRLPGGSTPWAVTRYAEQRALLSDPRVSKDPARPGFPMADLIRLADHDDTAEGDGEERPSDGHRALSFDTMDDPEHARLRRMVTGSFTNRRVEAMRPTVQRIVDGLIDDLLAGPNPVDLVEAFALPVPTLVICELLGVPYADRDVFQDNSRTIVSRSATATQRSAAMAEMTARLDDLIGVGPAAPADDVVSRLADKVKAGELTRQEAAPMAAVLLLAGHETTANMIALGTLALLQHPGQLALLRDTDDPGLVASAVEELLRYLHITHLGMRRTALEDIEIAGRTIRAGEGLISLNEIGNRDPEVFDDPDRLDIRRDARRHIAFGFGIHQCLGQQLARMELQVVYGTLYKRIPTLRPTVPLEDIPFKHDGIIYGVHELPVTW